MAFSIKAGIYNKLLSLGITAHIYYRELPQNPSYPATVYDVISDVVIGNVYDSGVHCFRRARVQLDVYALTVAAAEAAMEAYFDALDNFSGSLGGGESPSPFQDVVIFDEGANPDLDYEAEPTLRQIEGRSRDFMILY
jgi:hypothetical protein